MESVEVSGSLYGITTMGLGIRSLGAVMMTQSTTSLLDAEVSKRTFFFAQVPGFFFSLYGITPIGLVFRFLVAMVFA